jgi:serine O-acetyltransferase
MIQSRKDYLYYLEADRVALGRATPSLKGRLKNCILPDHIWRFQRILRKLEYYKNVRTGFGGKITTLLLTRKFQRLSIKMGFSIPINVFGPGLSIAHYGTIVINTGTRIGSNCRLHASVNIGTAAGYSDKAPQIGNNVYIGPGAKIYGDIRISNNIAIAANAVVNKSINEENIAVGGIPAKKISEIHIEDFLINATRIIELGFNTKRFSGLASKELNNKIISEQK